jgi:3-(3-hydroxy-phenyl)propionate hydroxylase
MLAENGDPPAVKYRQSLIPALVEGALCSDQGAPVGMRFPQPRVITDEGGRLLDDVVGYSFRLILRSDAVEKEIPESIRKTLAELDGVVLRLAEGSSTRKIGDLEWSIVEADGLVDKWLRDHGLIAALVRPDHYVFAVARQSVDLGGMSDLLKQNLHLVNRGIAPIWF